MGDTSSTPIVLSTEILGTFACGVLDSSGLPRATEWSSAVGNESILSSSGTSFTDIWATLGDDLEKEGLGVGRVVSVAEIDDAGDEIDSCEGIAICKGLGFQSLKQFSAALNSARMSVTFRRVAQFVSKNDSQDSRRLTLERVEGLDTLQIPDAGSVYLPGLL